MLRVGRFASWVIFGAVAALVWHRYDEVTSLVRDRVPAAMSELAGNQGRDPLVLVVDEEEAVIRFGEAGDVPPRRVTEPLERLFPRERVRWRFRGIDSRKPDALRAAIDESAPDLVVLLNENFVQSLEGVAWRTSFLVASELSRRAVGARYGQLRERIDVAFVSWHSGAWAKLLEHLEGMGAKGSRIGAFFDDALVDGGVAQDFEQAARQRGALPLVYRYEGWVEFQRILGNAVGSEAPSALVIPIANPLIGNSVAVARQVESYGLRAAYTRRDQVTDERGDPAGLVGVDPPPSEVYDQIARQIALILHGARASSLETLEPSRLETTINLQAARAIGAPIPYELLVEASEFVGR